MAPCWQNLLDGPSRTNGRQAYIGQRFTSFAEGGIFASYDLGRIGLDGAQIITDLGCGASSYIVASNRKCRVQDLSYYQPFLHGRIEVTAGILPNTFGYADTYLGGNLVAGSFGPGANLMIQSGLSNNLGSSPGLNASYHFDANWYDKLGVQRSSSPQGLVAEYNTANPYGVRFKEPERVNLSLTSWDLDKKPRRMQSSAISGWALYTTGAITRIARLAEPLETTTAICCTTGI